MSPRNTFYVNLVIEEIFLNILNHAYSDDGEHEVVIQVIVENGEIALRFEDDGTPFNPLSLPRADRSKPVMERLNDGLGMMFVRELRKTMEYDRRDGRNILTVYLNLEIQEYGLESDFSAD